MNLNGQDTLRPQFVQQMLLFNLSNVEERKRVLELFGLTRQFFSCECHFLRCCGVVLSNLIQLLNRLVDLLCHDRKRMGSLRIPVKC